MFINEKQHKYSNMKGSILDMTEVVLILLIAAITLFCAYYIFLQIETPFTDQGLDTDYLDDGMGALEIFDTMIPFVLLGMMFFVIISSSMIDTHPAMFIFSIVVFAIILILYMTFGNVFYYFSTDTDFTTVRDTLTSTSTIFDNILLIGFIFGILILVALYAKYRSGGTGGY